MSDVSTSPTRVAELDARARQLAESIMATSKAVARDQDTLLRDIVARFAYHICQIGIVHENALRTKDAEIERLTTSLRGARQECFRALRASHKLSFANARLRWLAEAVGKWHGERTRVFAGGGSNAAQGQAEAAMIRALTAFHAAAAGGSEGAAECYDCGRPYGHEHGFPDLVIPDDAWKEIAPVDGDGLLCPSCICKRLHDKGIECRGTFRSGPLAMRPETTGQS